MSPLACGCRRRDDGSWRRLCEDGQDLYRRLEGLTQLQLLWGRLLFKDRLADPDWTPGRELPSAKAAWDAHIGVG